MKLKDILNYYNTNFSYIEFRCLYKIKGKIYDDFFGACKYINGELIPLDHDHYSLEDKYDKWETWEKDGEQYLTVWERTEVIRG